MKKGDKLLGYGIFSGSMWGAEVKNWAFETVVGIQPTKADAKDCDSRIKHCLSRETRRIYKSIKLNIGHRNSPKFMRADKWLKERNSR